MQRKAMRRGKNLAFSEDTFLGEGRSNVIPRNVAAGWMQRGELTKKR